MEEIQDNAYEELYDQLRDWFRENISDNDSDWDERGDKLAHLYATEYQVDINRCVMAFTSFHMAQFISEIRRKNE